MKIGKFTTMGMQIVHKRITVEIWLYAGSEHNKDFRRDVDYIKKPSKATLQIGMEQDLIQKIAITLAANERLFFFDKNEIDGLNRNIEKGEDLILFRGIKFDVVEKPYEALDDYVCVKGRQFAQEPGKNPVSKDAPISSPVAPSVFGV